MLACRIAREASKFSRVSSVENLGPGVNTAADEYFPCVSNDQTWMFYTSRRNRFSDEDLYISYYAGEWMEGLPLPASFLTSKNEGMSTLVRSGRRMYFTACGRPDVKGSCDIWETAVQESSPKKPQPLAGDLNSEAWDSQASVSCDGTIMFFASNREGGLGGTDIWMSRMLPEGGWGAAENLGPPINTPGDEEAPFITNDGKSLFFSSTGHDGLGEQDIFLSRLDSAGRWSAPFNLGLPSTPPSANWASFSPPMEKRGISPPTVRAATAEWTSTASNCLSCSPAGPSLSSKAKSSTPSLGTPSPQRSSSTPAKKYAPARTDASSLPSCR
jgi:hypothetical protein